MKKRLVTIASALKYVDEVSLVTVGPLTLTFAIDDHVLFSAGFAAFCSIAREPALEARANWPSGTAQDNDTLGRDSKPLAGCTGGRTKVI
jgi:hypothetical protein